MRWNKRAKKKNSEEKNDKSIEQLKCVGLFDLDLDKKATLKFRKRQHKRKT